VIRNPFVTIQDAAAGHDLFVRYCAPCHGDHAEGRSAPNLVTSVFKHGDSDWALYRTVNGGLSDVAMPPLNLADKDTWQILTFVKSLRDADEDEPDSAGPQPASIILTTDVPAERIVHSAQDPKDWLTYSGSYRGWRHSELREIDASNVGQLRLAWSLQLQTNVRVETSPVVVDGIMYLTEPPGNVLAVDAATGHVLWRYTRSVPNKVAACCGRVNRGVAVLGKKVFIGTLDDHLVALDACTGKLLWDTKVSDYAEGFTITSAPLAFDETIVIGVAGGDYGTRGFVDAYDANTGAQRWRFHTIPEPGAFGSETWSGDSWKIGGGAPWMTGAYDPELGLVYWGTGNPAPDFNGDNRPGDNLFTSSVLALNAKTGERAWHFQFTPHDEHDWDATQIPVLVDKTIDGRERKLMLWANRNGFYYVLDRATGEFLQAKAYEPQTWAESIDKKGRPVLSAGGRPSPTGTLTIPGVYGGTNWWSPSYSPTTNLYYIVTLDSPWIFFRGTDADPSEYHDGPLMLGSTVTEPAPMHGAVRALDALTGETKWSIPFKEARRVDQIGGILTTASDLLFVGDKSDFLAMDARNGNELWRTNLGGYINANPISYAVGGEQMVAIAAGNSLFVFRL
jgi:alcohol dehydrogenase (cytochrome c)